MVKSHVKKRAIRHFSHWRYRNPIYKCLICGKNLRTTTHHFLCSKCHNKNRRNKLNLNSPY